MSFYDPKTAHSILMGLAGAIRRIARLEEAASIALGELQHIRPDATIPGIDEQPAGGPTDDLASLLVLAADLEARGRKLALRNGALRGLRRPDVGVVDKRHGSLKARKKGAYTTPLNSERVADETDDGAG